MSAAAIAVLQKLWEKLSFVRVDRVIAREPEDVLSIEILHAYQNTDGTWCTGHLQRTIPSNRTKDIHPNDLWRSRVSWRHYYGFADGIYFQKDDHCDVEWDQLTLDIRSVDKDTNGWEKPAKGALIAGEAVQGSKGKRFNRWFTCSEEFKFLVNAVRYGTKLSEIELASKLVGGRFADTYWAIARLALFDNVQTFVDLLVSKPDKNRHPLHGREYASRSSVGNPHPKVYWEGMSLPRSPDEFVHELAYRLDEPKWWQDFQRLAAEQDIPFVHDRAGSMCVACHAEKNKGWAEDNDGRW